MTTESIPSPLGLLHRSHHAGTLAVTDALICTFNQDLAFFERAVLGVLSQTKARITLLGDVNMVDHDAYSVRRAGTTYLPGLVAHHAAFHPKLLLLVSEDHATVSIGSGNLTLSGWQGNDELWTIHRLDQDDQSPIAADVAEWLRELAAEPGLLRLSTGVADRLEHAAAKLDAFGRRRKDGDARLVSSLTTPIIEQLPRGPVEDLILYAPYHDNQARALQAIVERFEPRQIHLAFQARHTSVNGPRAAEVLGDLGVSVAIDDQPFRHGKLIEWVNADGGRLALTGSPNLSDVALLRSAMAGGNVEIGVIAPTATSLKPPATAGEPPSLVTIHHTRSEGTTDAARPPVLVLDATKTGPVVQVGLLRPLLDGAQLEHSPWGASPDHWVTSPIVEHHDLNCTIGVDLPGGSRIRVRLADGSWSQFVAVIDFDRLRRASRSTGSTTKRAPDVINVFGDDSSLMGSLLDTLTDLSAASSQPAPSPTQRTAGTGTGSTYQAWDDYLDYCHERIGDINISFALGLPMTTTATTNGTKQFFDWDDDEPINDELGALEEDEAEDEEQGDTPDFSNVWYRPRLEDEARRRYRRQIEKFTDQLLATDGGPNPIAHLAAIRLVLLFAVGGIWDKNQEWRDRLLNLVAALDRDAPDPEWETSAASLAALALSIVDFSLPSTGQHTLLHNFYERTAERIGYLTLGADDERIRQYAEGLASRYRFAVDPENVRDLTERITIDDPLERAIEKFVDVTLVNRVIVLGNVTGVSQPFALRAQPNVDAASPVGIYANGPSDWTLVLWDDPDLFIVRSGKRPGTAMTHHYIYKHGTPASEIRSSGRPSSSREVGMTMATKPVPARAIEIASWVGINDVLNPHPDLKVP